MQPSFYLVWSGTLWDWSTVRSDIATMTPPIAPTFVPQMGNDDSVSGMSFKEGCQSGQPCGTVAQSATALPIAGRHLNPRSSGF